MKPALHRRGFLSWSTAGLGSIALSQLLAGNAWAAGRKPHFNAKARRVIHIGLCGGLSHLDSFDDKPELKKFHGKPLSYKEKPDTFFGQLGLIRQSDWEFKKRGQSGLAISELFPNIAAHADKLTILRSMTADSANHTPASYYESSGFAASGFPSMGAWTSFGLGCETEELPAYVVMPDPRGMPNGGVAIWSSAFLPAEHQGTVLSSGTSPVRDLFPSGKYDPIREADGLKFLKEMNEQHLQNYANDSLLAARIRSYELAARMQLSVPKVTDISTETKDVHELYGLDRKVTETFGRNCLLARRLLEKGVRYVQLFSGGPVAGNPRPNWDAHENVKQNHSTEAERIDKPIAGLLADLQQRGMLKDTLVLFTTEFGRTPFTQSASDQIGKGRDHNKYGFSVWMAGAGLKPGMSYGQTDEIGWKVVQNPIHWYDFHATVLHLLGLDHEKLSFYHNGIHRRLTNVHGTVIRDILA